MEKGKVRMIRKLNLDIIGIRRVGVGELGAGLVRKIN
jgi:hypothetical protein